MDILVNSLTAFLRLWGWRLTGAAGGSTNSRSFHCWWRRSGVGTAAGTWTRSGNDYYKDVDCPENVAILHVHAKCNIHRKLN